MIGIYKWTNKINNKCYIGQSICIEKRYQQHIRATKNSQLPLHRALAKYGISNFNFEVLEECSRDELDEKEIFYIKQYNCLVPNGYNLQKGGNSHRYELYFKFNEEDINLIYDMIKNTTKTFEDIGAEFGVSGTMIRFINAGIEYARDNISYPIRTPEDAWELRNKRVSQKLSGENSYRTTISEETALSIIYDLINHQELTSVQIANKYNTTTDVVKDINRGKSWKYLDRPKPCRPDFGNHKIDLDDALQMIDILQNTFLSPKDIMSKYPKFSYHMINRINNGENWHQDNVDYPIRKYKISTQKLTTTEVQDIAFRLYTSDDSISDIAKEYNISPQSIRDINNHKSYSYITTNYPNPIKKS